MITVCTCDIVKQYQLHNVYDYSSALAEVNSSKSIAAVLKMLGFFYECRAKAYWSAAVCLACLHLLGSYRVTATAQQPYRAFYMDSFS